MVARQAIAQCFTASFPRFSQRGVKKANVSAVSQPQRVPEMRSLQQFPPGLADTPAHRPGNTQTTVASGNDHLAPSDALTVWRMIPPGRSLPARFLSGILAAYRRRA